jgi:hypothetical protein
MPKLSEGTEIVTFKVLAKLVSDLNEILSDDKRINIVRNLEKDVYEIHDQTAKILLSVHTKRELALYLNGMKEQLQKKDETTTG